MKKDMENMKNEVSFNTNIKSLSLSVSLTVTIPVIIMFKSRTWTALLNSPNLIGPLILWQNKLAHFIFLGPKYRARGYPSRSTGYCPNPDWSK